MPNQLYRPASDPIQAIKKLILSSLVIGSFLLYVIFERLTRPDSSPLQASTIPTATQSAIQQGPIPFPTTGAGVPSTGLLSQPTDTPPVTNNSAFKTGTFQGQPVDAYYGLVQVQVNIQGGVIRNVDVLQYPSDRRTSVRINSIAIPWLQQEAIQAQSANVNIISGATLTSEGFAESLQTALQAAQH
jgi:uncharacterized protein with FMN-binding domain